MREAAEGPRNPRGPDRTLPSTKKSLKARSAPPIGDAWANTVEFLGSMRRAIREIRVSGLPSPELCSHWSSVSSFFSGLSPFRADLFVESAVIQWVHHGFTTAVSKADAL